MSQSADGKIFLLLGHVAVAEATMMILASLGGACGEGPSARFVRLW